MKQVIVLFLSTSSAISLSKKKENVSDNTLIQIEDPRGEKQWQGWAQDFVDWEDNQTMMANSRIPYHSTLQLDAEMEGMPGGSGGPPAAPVRGEKQWQGWAQDFVDWEDNQTMMANSRIPYHSTLQFEDEVLAQLNSDLEGVVRGEKQWQSWAQDLNDWEDNQTNMANSRIPYQSAVQLDSDIADVRGEKQWQGWAQDFVDWEDNQTMMANSRIPYHSTLQTEDDEDDENSTDPVKVEISSSVPINAEFVHISTDDGELMKIEENNVPLNFRF